MTEIEFLPESAKKIASFPIRSNFKIIPNLVGLCCASSVSSVKVTIALVERILSKWSRQAGDGVDLNESNPGIDTGISASQKRLLYGRS